MMTRDQWHKFMDLPVVQWTIFALGVVLIILSPLAGVVPGPGGILVFALGLAMVLKTSMWAKRHYVRFKRKQPKAGHWIDWGLRRRSAKRREELRKQRESELAPPAPFDLLTGGPVDQLIPDPPVEAPETAKPEDQRD